MTASEESDRPLRVELYFLLHRSLGSRIRSAWREFQAWEQLSPDALQRAVEARLLRPLENASAADYYRRLNLPRRPGDRAEDWLRRFPILTRVLLREHFVEFVVDDRRGEITSPDSVCRRRYDWLVVKTGGTTGVPTAVVEDANSRDWNRATRLYAARQCGFPLGVPYFRLWGSE